MCGCLLHAPYWGLGLQPRHVLWGTIINLYVLNRTSKHMQAKLTELEGETDSSTLIVYFNTSLLMMDRTTRQKTSKEIENLNNSVNQAALTANRRLQNTPHTNGRMHILPKCTYNIF